MNNTIEKILLDQKYTGYNLNFSVNNYDFTDTEKVLFEYDLNNIHFFIHPEASQVIKIRINYILPYIQKYFYSKSPNKKISFLVHLGDSNQKYTNINIPIISFAKKKYLPDILIPNVDFFTGLFKTLLGQTIHYDIEFDQKITGSCFAGSSTGQMECNKRIRYCLSMQNKPNTYAKITSLLQGSLDEWSKIFPNIVNIIDQTYMSIEDQLKYKVLVNIDGNTLCYSRLYWQILSNSIPVYIEPDSSSTQFFDTDEMKKYYFISSIDDTTSLYEYILNNNHQEQILLSKQKAKIYLYNCFDDYMTNSEIFLNNIFTYIFDNLLTNN